MNYNITGKHLDLTQPMKDAVADALEHSERLYDNIIDANVILSQDHNTFIAESVMHIDGKKFFVKSENDDMYKAISDMGERLAHNLRRKKEKRAKVDHATIRHYAEVVEDVEEDF